MLRLVIFCLYIGRRLSTSAPVAQIYAAKKYSEAKSKKRRMCDCVELFGFIDITNLGRVYKLTN